MNEDLIRCAQINFENIAKLLPSLAKQPLWVIAKEQLDAGIENRELDLEKHLGPPKLLGTIHFDEIYKKKGN